MTTSNSNLSWQERAAKVYMDTTRRVPLTLVRGQGSRVWDDAGKQYLDFVAGWAVDTLGHCHPVMQQALAEQSKTLIQTSNQFFTIPQIELAEILVANSCMDRVFFSNSGAEANEGAVKLARKYGRMHHNGAYEIITALNSFHGRTLAMVSATGQPSHQEAFKPDTPGFVNVIYDDINAIKTATHEKTCAVMFEPIQGEGGVVMPRKEYLKQVRAWCDEKGLLLIFDEIQTGIGRLGTLFGYQYAGVEPDVMTLAKGLGGGVPIGAFMAKQKAAVFTPGDHGSTYGGNPLMCAVGRDVMRYVLAEDVLANVQRRGKRLMEGLQALQAEYPWIVEVRGAGLLQAIQFKQDISQDVLKACLNAGLLVNAPRPNTIRFMPALVINDSEIDEGLSKLATALAQVARDKQL